MKAKYYMSLFSLLLLPLTSAKAVNENPGGINDGNTRVVINNYYDDYDYSYASRINRFHRSYATYDYYSPFYADPYWYNYRPFSLGMNFYGGFGLGLGFGLSFNIPLFSDWNFGYYPYYGSSYYWGYDPWYYNYWYSPFYFNYGYRSWWHHNYYGWYDRPYGGFNHYYSHRMMNYNSFSRRGYSYNNVNDHSSGYNVSRRGNSSVSTGQAYNNSSRRSFSSSGHSTGSIYPSDRRSGNVSVNRNLNRAGLASSGSAVNRRSSVNSGNIAPHSGNIAINQGPRLSVNNNRSTRVSRPESMNSVARSGVSSPSFGGGSHRSGSVSHSSISHSSVSHSSGGHSSGGHSSGGGRSGGHR